MSLALALARGVFSARYGGGRAASDGDSKTKGARKSSSSSRSASNGDEGEWMQRAVSYTHLTLPTNREV